MRELKRCSINSSHFWMGDIQICPYCNFSQEARIDYLKKEKIKECKNEHPKNQSIRNTQG